MKIDKLADSGQSKSTLGNDRTHASVAAQLMTDVKATMTIADSDRAAPFSDRNCITACMAALLDDSAKLSLTIREVRAQRSRFGLRSLFLNGTFRPHISPRCDRINDYPQARERVVDLALDALSLRS
jgi:hypothetical protein